MAGNEAFQIEGRVIEARPNRTYCVELANGHRLTAFVAGRAKQRFAGLVPGETVTLQLTPYDLSVGRILIETKTIGT
jgi:translation initiation factor IF-1